MREGGGASACRGGGPVGCLRPGTIAGQDEPPRRFLAGADAIEGAAAKARELLAQAEASRALGGSLGHDDTGA
ncbi:hypothetical protein [Streptomyces griseorubiginosus]|uniref:hypothetical protein n=1 Tax=Streptomyces griseorubiginosus TaxID=67304 RepID=UPI002E803224|nr:hypothetical protein [Streptomyces griseorubiginosus]WUB49500.1 hypothetical protein OHN19_41650 [Streptomyces griseorubiginosus]WUB58029.1 hypothetical protein OG942_41660 [Streptomyces griseorubiginosus]